MNNPPILIKVGQPIAEVERTLILATVAQSESLEQAAATLGISLKTLYNRRKEYGAVFDEHRRLA